MFNAERGLLLLGRPPKNSDLLFVCWPVLVHRVTAPVVRAHHVDIFEKVVLGLCRAGVRQPDDIARRIHQNPRLCAYVMRRLKESGLLEPAGKLTPKGLNALATNTISEEPELIVTYVFQDATRPAGELWPRVAPELVFQPTLRARGDDVDLRLDSAGHPRRVTAYLIPACDEARSGRLPVPSAEHIIGAVHAHRAAEADSRAERLARDERDPAAAQEAEQELRALHTEFSLPRSEAMTRVWDIRPPTAEYLLTWLRPDAAGEGAAGWQSCDPFGLDPDLMLHHLVLDQVRSHPRLGAALTGLTLAVKDHLNERYRDIAREVRSRADTTLVQELGPQIREHPRMLDLLVGLEDAAARGDSAADVEAVARETIRAYEHLFRRLVDEYRPVPPRWRLPDRAETAHRQAHQQLADCAERLGFSRLPYFLKYALPEFCRTLTNTAGRPDKLAEKISALAGGHSGSVQKLLPWALLAAGDPGNPDRMRHPLYALAKRRPALLTELERANTIRNRGSHAERDAAQGIAGWCRELALDAARTAFELSPEPERNSAR